MIEGNVKNDSDPTLMGGVDQVSQILESAVVRVDVLVVGYVIAMITCGWKDGHEPEDTHLQVIVTVWIPVVQVVEVFTNALEIPLFPLFAGWGGIARCVSERPDEDVVHEIIVPLSKAVPCAREMDKQAHSQSVPSDSTV
jgi:hypothetical protein